MGSNINSYSLESGFYGHYDSSDEVFSRENYGVYSSSGVAIWGI